MNATKETIYLIYRQQRPYAVFFWNKHKESMDLRVTDSPSLVGYFLVRVFSRDGGNWVLEFITERLAMQRDELFK